MKLTMVCNMDKYGYYWNLTHWHWRIWWDFAIDNINWCFWNCEFPICHIPIYMNDFVLCMYCVVTGLCYKLKFVLCEISRVFVCKHCLVVQKSARIRQLLHTNTIKIGIFGIILCFVFNCLEWWFRIIRRWQWQFCWWIGWWWRCRFVQGSSKGKNFWMGLCQIIKRQNIIKDIIWCSIFKFNRCSNARFWY